MKASPSAKPAFVPRRTYRDAVQISSSSSAFAAPPPLTDEPPLTPEQEDALQRMFPTRVVISQSKLAASAAVWTFAVTGKCLGRDVSSESMEKALSLQWSHVGEWELFPMSFGFYVFRFSSQADCDAILFGGPWIVEGAALALSPFDAGFRPTQSQATRAVMWVRLPDLPPAFWSEELVTDILSVIGRVVRLDDNTRTRTKGRFARAAVELDLRQPLLPGVAVDVEGGSPPSFWQNFRYENLHSFCSCCRRVGHRVLECSSSPSISSSPLVSSSTTAAAVDALGDWSQRLLVRRRHHVPHRPLRSASSPTVDSGSAPPRGVNPTSSGPAQGPTTIIASVVMDDVAALGNIPKSPPQSAPGPQDYGPGLGLTGPFSSTSASLLKHFEPLGSLSPSQAIEEPVSLGKNDGGSPVLELASAESQLIRDIMEDNSDNDTSLSIDDGVHFTTVGKKKKGKAKMTSICLRPAPRDRAPMKRTKVTSAPPSGKFSLLADLLDGASATDLATKYGYPP